MYGRAIAILAAILAIGSIAMGCGASASSDSTPPLTKAAFIKKGDAICEKVPKRYTVRLEALAKEREQKFNSESKPPKQKSNPQAAAPPLRTAAAELDELSPPAGEEQQAEAIVAALEEAVDEVEEGPGSELSGPKSPLAGFQKLAKEYGFKFCSSL